MHLEKIFKLDTVDESMTKFAEHLKYIPTRENIRENLFHFVEIFYDILQVFEERLKKGEKDVKLFTILPRKSDFQLDFLSLTNTGLWNLIQGIKYRSRNNFRDDSIDKTSGKKRTSSSIVEDNNISGNDSIINNPSAPPRETRLQERRGLKMAIVAIVAIAIIILGMNQITKLQARRGLEIVTRAIAIIIILMIIIIIVVVLVAIVVVIILGITQLLDIIVIVIAIAIATTVVVVVVLSGVAITPGMIQVTLHLQRPRNPKLQEKRGLQILIVVTHLLRRQELLCLPFTTPPTM